MKSNIHLLKRKLKMINEQLKEYEGRQIHVRVHNSYGAVYLVTQEGEEKKERYMSLKLPQTAELLKVHYFRLLKPIIEDEIQSLEKYQENYNPTKKISVFMRYPLNLRKLIAPVFPSYDEYGRRWATGRYEKNPFPLDGPYYETKRGEQVRSKNECIVLDMLTDMGLYYRYEPAYSINGKTYYPDIAVLHPITIEEHYIEIFGLLNNPEYFAKTFRKITDYQQGKDVTKFIFIFDTPDTPLNTNAVRNIIARYFLE